MRVLNTKGHSWTIERLRTPLVRERIAELALIKRSARRAPEDRLMTLVAGIAIADPELSLRDIAAQLEGMHERTARSGRQWQASSVKALLDRACQLGSERPIRCLTHDTAEIAGHDLSVPVVAPNNNSAARSNCDDAGSRWGAT